MATIRAWSPSLPLYIINAEGDLVTRSNNRRMVEVDLEGRVLLVSSEPREDRDYWISDVPGGRKRDVWRWIVDRAARHMLYRAQIMRVFSSLDLGAQA